MKILILTLIIIISIFSNNVFAIKCNGTGTCLHSGIFNNTTCLCRCVSSAHNGKLCQYVNCTYSAQPRECDTYHVAACSLDIVRNFCPLKCGSFACTLVSSLVVTQCNIDSCLNGGTYNNRTWYFSLYLICFVKPYLFSNLKKAYVLVLPAFMVMSVRKYYARVTTRV